MPEAPNPKIRHELEIPSSVATCAFDYAELELVTNFSFLRGASHPDELVYEAASQGYRAIAITDHNTLAGVVRAYAAAKQCGLKILIGSRLTLVDGPPLLVYATNRAAYGRLCRLLTLGKRRVEKGDCHLTLADFLEHSEGLIAAVCGFADQTIHIPDSFPIHESTTETSNPLHALRILREAIGDRVSLAFSRMYTSNDDSYAERMLALSRHTRIPLLATNDVHYHDPNRRMLQDVLTCVREKCSIHNAGFKLFPNGERYLKPPEQMHMLFRDIPEAIRRGLEIVDQCNFSMSELQYEYPHEVVPSGFTPIEYLTKCTREGAIDRYPNGIPASIEADIQKELTFIHDRKLEPYFLTVCDLVQFARSRDILCQGRGSAANSTVCYCLGVTGVDPTKSGLLFERFLSTARDEPPDIDIDFEHERREEVIQYVYEKYGRDRAGMTATLITYRGRSAVRDVGKALGLSLDLVDSLAKRLDWWHRGSLTEEQLKDAGVDTRDATIRAMVQLSTELLGFPRHLGQHTGGMVISNGPLCELVPIENASMADRTVVEWDKNDIEDLKLVKVDILALGMLTVISKSFHMLMDKTHTDEPGPFRRHHLYSLPQDDPLVYAMIQDADTVGVFQIESRAQMSMLPRLKPAKFYDLVIEVAIVRPGPIQGDMVHPYLRRRDGTEPVTFPSKELEEVLGRTLGVPLFQEQAMKVAMVAAGFSGTEADKLRRAMASWRKNGAINAFHEKIIEGMIKNGYEKEFAEKTFHQIQGFGEYGFPESHSASFALLVYVSCWLKRYHPGIFCCAMLNSQPMGFYAPAQLVRDAREHGVRVLPIDVNHSDWDCTLIERETPEVSRIVNAHKQTWGLDGPGVRLGMRQIKGFREAFAQRISRARAAIGMFESVEHFHQVTELPRSAIQLLAEADAFGSMNLLRRPALWDTMELSDEQMPLFTPLPVRGERLGEGSSLFENAAEIEEPPPSLPLSTGRGLKVRLPEMPLGQEVMTDYAMTSLSLKAHPLSLVREQLAKQKIKTAREVNAMTAGKWVKVAGLVLVRQRPGTASGIVFITLEDETGVVNLIVRANVFERYRAAARHAALLQCDGYVERKDKVVHIMAKRFFDLSDLVSGYAVGSRDFH